MLGLLACRRRRGDLLQADTGSAVRDPALLLVAGGAAADAGLGSPGRAARHGRPADRASSPRSAGSCASTGTSASARPAGQGRRRAPAGLHGTQLRARALLRQRAATTSCSWTAGFTERANARMHKTLRARPIDRLDRGARGDGAAARRGARRRPALGAQSRRRTVPALRYLRLLARPRAGRPPRRDPRSPSARSPRSRWTAARSPAATRARSPSTARSPRSSMPAR